MAFTNRFSEVAYPLADIAPASYTTEQNTGYVSLANYHRAAIVIHCGVIGGNLDIDLEQGTDTSGTGAKTIDATNKDMAKTATTDNGTMSVIEFRTEELDIANGFDCINVEVTPAGAGIFSVILYGIEPRFAPVPTTNWDDIND